MEELGMQAELTHRFDFEYRASYGDIGTEHELCAVFTGISSDSPNVNASEIADWRWISPAELTRAFTHEKKQYTPWSAMEWEILIREHIHAFVTHAESHPNPSTQP